MNRPETGGNERNRKIVGTQRLSLTLLFQPGYGFRMAIRFTSTLHARYREDLEDLLFFNANQSSVARGIVDTIDRYGLPRVVEKGRSLLLTVGGPFETQTLFALEMEGEYPELVGALIYTRIDEETIVLLHMTVNEEYCLNGKQSRKMLTVKLFDKLKTIARQIKGVRFLEITYGGDSSETIDVRRRDTRIWSLGKKPH